MVNSDEKLEMRLSSQVVRPLSEFFVRFLGYTSFPLLAGTSVQIKIITKKQDANTKVFLSYNKVVETIK